MNNLNIIIDSTHSEELAQAIVNAEKRCRARTITVEHILSACAQAEEFLGIPKYALKDVRVFVDPHAQRFPNAYGKHGAAPMSTHFTMVHNGKNWHLIDIERAKTCVPSMALQFRLTPLAKEKIIERKMNTDWTWYRSGECFIPTDKLFDKLFKEV